MTTSTTSAFKGYAQVNRIVREMLPLATYLKTCSERQTHVFHLKHKDVLTLKRYQQAGEMLGVCYTPTGLFYEGHPILALPITREVRKQRDWVSAAHDDSADHAAAPDAPAQKPAER